MMDHTKYQRGYFMPPQESLKWVHKEYIETPPTWCSVDLRDGNQSLIIPMSLDEKVEFFKTLVKIGFKEIEVGFPAASETEYIFLRTLIEENLIPDDVTIQVLTQAREHIIKKTFESLKGCKKSIVHLYNSTSLAQREQVFRKSKAEIIQIAKDGALLLQNLANETEGNFQFQYSPESFTGTEVDFALDICNEVLDIWQPTPENKVIINLPVTVSMSLPHVYASQIEYMCDHLNNRENVVVSLHPHNDRGCAIADTELGILAGADRVEGTLFGNGERTGNVDIVTLALNMYTHGVDPKLDFSNLPEINAVYERVTRMHIYDRQPYSGALVFAAFSGSHQDAIAKGMHYREEKDSNLWTVPYLPIDPTDLGRHYEKDVIRINSQSGKGGIGYVLEQKFGYDLPTKMREDFGYTVKNVSDHQHKELSPDDVKAIFTKTYVAQLSPYQLASYHFKQLGDERIQTTVEISDSTQQITKITAEGNGRFDAICQALSLYFKTFNSEFNNLIYKEHALGEGSNSRAAAYVGIKAPTGELVWGAGIKNDIIDASVEALLSAINRAIV